MFPGRAILLFSFVLICLQLHVKAQCSRDDITADMGFKVRAVHIKARYVPESLQKQVNSVMNVGGVYDPANRSRAQQVVSDAFTKEELNFPIQLIGATSVLYINSDVCDVSDTTHPKEVEVSISPYYIRIDLYSIGNNILPIPRGARPSFYEKVPAFLLGTAPVLGITHDKQSGASLFLQTTTDFLHTQRSLKKKDDAKKMKLELMLDARKSLSEKFYGVNGALQLSSPVYKEGSVGWRAGISGMKSADPLLKGSYEQENFQFWASVNGNGSFLLWDKYLFNGNGRFFKNNYIGNDFPFNQNKEHAFGASFLTDGRLWNGFSRFGLWFDAADQGENFSPYQRLAGRFGVATALGKGHQSPDLEINLGAGKTWGTPLPSQQFYAGSTLWNFLYEGFASPKNLSFPTGPLVRSLGERENGISKNVNQGGESYWNINLNFSIPIARWSKPLIPDIVIDEDNNSTLRTALKKSLVTAENFIAVDLETNGDLSEDAADSVAKKMVDKDIRPTVNFLADRANVYSIRPIVLFDVAQLSRPHFNAETFISAGIGVQLTIIVARLEASYLKTLRPSGLSGGNFFLRLIVQNFY